MAERSIKCTYRDLGSPTEIGNYEWRGHKFRVNLEMIEEAKNGSNEAAWEFFPFLFGGRVIFYETLCQNKIGTA